jgi:hypothetical protein
MRWLWILVAVMVAGVAGADESLKDIACRSVHLGYPAPTGTAFYTEMTVEKSAEGTYFMAAGWSKGYFGIQELAKGKKLVLFSVWDPTAGDDPKTVDDTKRVRMLHKDEAARVQRFGGEGTGGQCFFDYDWKIGQTYRFLVIARPDGAERTAYSGYFYLPESKHWKHLVTFSTLAEGKLLEGYYSFVEDFRRNGVSATKVRRATYGNGWVRSAKGDWLPLDEARFTGDSNPVTNIDAGQSGDRFFLVTGGETENKTTPLRQLLSLKARKVTIPPADLPKLNP